jgi:hypothetical protein
MKPCHDKRDVKQAIVQCVMRKINQSYVNATNEYLWVSFLFLPICAPVPFMS